MAFSPITNGFDTTPKALPLGVSISDRIDIKPIRKQLANQIHIAHHSYVNRERHNSVVNHGVFLDDTLVGAISYAYLLASKPICGYESDEYMEVARVTIQNRTPNLASCAMAESQDRFMGEYGNENGIGLLVTYVHEEYEGTMFRALKSKGWQCTGYREPGQAGNRREREIRDVGKFRWVCEV